MYFGVIFFIGKFNSLNVLCWEMFATLALCFADTANENAPFIGTIMMYSLEILYFLHA